MAVQLQLLGAGVVVLAIVNILSPGQTTDLLLQS
jgi:hypothetical protein